MTNEQIEKLASYIAYLRSRFNVYMDDGNTYMLDCISSKTEAAREIAIVFDCREEVFSKVEEMEGRSL